MLIDFREKGREGERQRNIDVREKTSTGCLLVHTLTGDQFSNAGRCPNQESNPRPFSLQDEAPTKRATLARARVNAFLKFHKDLRSKEQGRDKREVS